MKQNVLDSSNLTQIVTQIVVLLQPNEIGYNLENNKLTYIWIKHFETPPRFLRVYAWNSVAKKAQPPSPPPPRGERDEQSRSNRRKSFPSRSVRNSLPKKAAKLTPPQSTFVQNDFHKRNWFGTLAERVKFCGRKVVRTVASGPFSETNRTGVQVVQFFCIKRHPSPAILFNGDYLKKDMVAIFTIFGSVTKLFCQFSKTHYPPKKGSDTKEPCLYFKGRIMHRVIATCTEVMTEPNCAQKDKKVKLVYQAEIHTFRSKTI
ncbi:hypothetical protein WN51_04705 [Melipona quadrifasciata]|uniref:Uncharacterized protein n=1 Tax=Melipona quadrifasciata TaxID=166423 RepID=A0A0M9AB30_9HYME|nr:hypothetical protein WN51_04705 [Melipona quadrifasciata]